MYVYTRAAGGVFPIKISVYNRKCKSEMSILVGNETQVVVQKFSAVKI